MKRVFEIVCVAAIVAALGSTAMADVFNLGPGLTSLETVPVGNLGNTGELSGAGAGYPGYGPDRICGAVNYTYNIGKYEVTNAQYIEFLNAVASHDPNTLYNTDMGGDYWETGGITRGGSDGGYTYTVPPNRGDRPVSYVSWYDTLRFANWLHNGQPTGAQGSSTTEDGAYDMSLGSSVVRKPGATWVLPTEDEWYKAAYHKNDGVTGNYFAYPTSSDSMPGRDMTEATNPGNNANSSGSPSPIDPPHRTTVAGEFELSDSPYGTFDQGGNLWEYTEADMIGDGSHHGLRGGALGSHGDKMQASHRYRDDPTYNERYDVGFRVAHTSAPPPPRPPRLYAVCVGSNDTNFLGQVSVNGQGDALAINAKLRAFSMYADSQVRLFDFKVDGPHKTSVSAAIQIIEEQILPGDIFVFSYSGHGWGGIGKDDGLGLSEGPFGDPDISDKSLPSWFQSEAWAEVNKLFIVDSCHSGGLGRSIDWDGQWQDDLSGLPRSALLAACGEDEVAVSDFFFECRGYLSQYVEGALTLVNGYATADTNRNGLTFDELVAFVQGEVAASSGYTGYLKDGGGGEDPNIITVEPSLYAWRSDDFDLHIPEPTTLSILTLGGLTILRKRRRRS